MLRVVPVGPRRDEDVSGFDVPVHQVVVVCGVEGGRHLGGDPQGGRDGERALPVQQTPQVQSWYVAHGDVEDAVRLAGFEDRHDVRVLDRGGHPRLVGETAPEGVVAGPLGGDQLDRDRAVQAQVLGAVDDGHPTSADHALDLVSGDLLPDQPGGPARVVAQVRAHQAPPSSAGILSSAPSPRPAGNPARRPGAGPSPGRPLPRLDRERKIADHHHSEASGAAS